MSDNHWEIETWMVAILVVMILFADIIIGLSW